MKINILMKEETEEFCLHQSDLKENMHVDFEEVQLTNKRVDYNTLYNKPSINSIVLEGALNARDLGLGNIYYDTKENWNAQISLIAEESAIYIYSNYSYTTGPDGNRIPIAGLKIGDGTSYLIDLPFVSSQTSADVLAHIANTHIHVTQTDKNNWNHKVSSFLKSEDLEDLVLSKTQYVIKGDIYYG